MSIVKICRWLYQFATKDINKDKLYTLNDNVPFALGLLRAISVENHEILAVYELPRISGLRYEYPES